MIVLRLRPVIRVLAQVVVVVGQCAEEARRATIRRRNVPVGGQRVVVSRDERQARQSGQDEVVQRLTGRDPATRRKPVGGAVRVVARDFGAVG